MTVTYKILKHDQLLQISKSLLILKADQVLNFIILEKMTTKEF